MSIIIRVRATTLSAFVAMIAVSSAFAQAPQAVTAPSPISTQAAVVPAVTDVPKTRVPGSEPIKLLEGDAYPATLENLIRVALKYKKLDLDNDEVIDDLAKLEYCDVYNRDHFDEFTWRKVRVALRQKIASESSRYPTLIYLNRREVFGQYNFSEKMLMLKPSSLLQSVNLLALMSSGTKAACNQPVHTLAHDFVAILDKKLNIDGVRMTEDEAKSVVSGLTKSGRMESPAASGPKTSSVSDTNPENDVTRLGYGRYIVDLTGPSDPPVGMKDALVFSGHIESVTFFEDPYYQKPFWRGLASVREYAESESLASEIEFKGIRDEPGTLPGANVTPISPPH